MITAILGSQRDNGNTEKLTNEMLSGIKCEMIHLRKHDIEIIADNRHTKEGFNRVDDDYYMLLDYILKSDTLIFATPLYWYGMSGIMKNFLIRFSESLRDKSINFKEIMKNKKAYVIVVGGDDVKIKALPLIQQFEYVFKFLDIEFVDYIIGQGNEPSDIYHDKLALSKARDINNRLSDEHIVIKK